MRFCNGLSEGKGNKIRVEQVTTWIAKKKSSMRKSCRDAMPRHTSRAHVKEELLLSVVPMHAELRMDLLVACAYNFYFHTWELFIAF